MNDCPAVERRDSIELRESIVRHLCEQGVDEQLAQVFSGAILDYALTWEVEPSHSPDDCNAIMAFSFGYQLSPKGSRKPGPVNEALAALVLNQYRRKPRPVYAQSEIAVLVAYDLPARHFHPIQPRISARTGAVKSLGTEAVIAEIAKEVRDPAAAAPWLLIAHRHHAVRCSMIASERGFGSVVAPELPDQYDHNSAQLWRRRHLTYLVSDVISRLTMYATHCLYPAILRAQAIHADDPRATESANDDRPPAQSQTVPALSKVAFQDQLNGDVPLLGSDEDYAAIPCYDPQNR